MGSLLLLQGGLPDPGIKPGSPALQVDSSPAELSGKPTNGRSQRLYTRIEIHFDN